MANETPGNVERDVVRPPNPSLQPRGRADDGFLPINPAPSKVMGTNYGYGGDRRGGSANLAGQPSPVTPANHVFQVGMGFPPSSDEPTQ